MWKRNANLVAIAIFVTLPFSAKSVEMVCAEVVLNGTTDATRLNFSENLWVSSRFGQKFAVLLPGEKARILSRIQPPLVDIELGTKQAALVQAMAFSLNRRGTLVLSVLYDDSVIRRFDIVKRARSNPAVRLMRASRLPILQTQFSSDGQRVAILDAGGEVSIYDARSGTHLGSFGKEVRQFSLDAEGRRVLTVNAREVSLFNVDFGESIMSKQLISPILYAEIAETGLQWLWVPASGAIRIHDDRGKPLGSMYGGYLIHRAHFTRGEQQNLIVVLDDGKRMYWRINETSPRYQLMGAEESSNVFFEFDDKVHTLTSAPKIVQWNISR